MTFGLFCFTGGPALDKLPPRFRDSGVQYIISAEGQSVTLIVELVELTEETEISWSKDGKQLEPDDRRQLLTDKNSAQLVIDNLQKRDSGIYSASARSPGGNASRELELRVTADGADENGPPAFLRRLNDRSVKIGTRTRFLVETKSSPPETISWYHNGEIVKEGERYRFTNEDSFHCVDVGPALEQDGGRWTCTSRNRAGSSTCTCQLNVLIPKTYRCPEFVEELRALLTEHGTVALECKVIGVPTPLLRWFKDGIEIKAGDVFALTANPEDPTTLGTYTCEATNCMGKAVSSSRVHVVGRGSREGSLKPADSDLSTGPPPTFSKDLKDEIVKIGDPLVLSCHVSVPPWPMSIVWYNSEGKINDEDREGRYKQMADGIGGYMLEIKPTEAEDQGQWKCVATGEGGAISVSNCTVNMIIPKHFRKPRFMESLKAVLTEEGLVSFECKVVGSPTPLLRWFKDGQELKPGDVYQLTGTNSLGSYCCIAKNCMGEAVSSAELTVEDIQNQLNDEERQQLLSRSQAPKFLKGLKSCEARINETFKFTVQVTVTPEPTLIWYRDDQPIEAEPGKYLINRESVGVCHLDITPLEFMDQAEWKCMAKNDFGHSITSCFLKLVIPKHFRKPMFLESLRAVLSEEGAVNLECKVIGVPQPVLVWYKDGLELKPGDIHRITSGEDGTCCLGTYTCEAKNCMGIVASSASLLGFEDQTKTRAEQQRVELARVPSLSTIQEERTSQLYDTPQGDISLTLNDHGEVSFSFDGKEVSVSLYETPDITEEEAIQIVEMYADQLSEHVSEHNVVELPPLRFTKETSTSGNLVMEAVLVDVSEDYFTSVEEEADLRTEADVDDIYSVTDEGARSLSPSSDAPKRPPRKKNDSPKSTQESYYSLSKNASVETDAADESLALDSESFGDFASAMSSDKMHEEDMAFQVAAITETASLPGDVVRESPSTQNTHEIGSDLRVNREEDKSKKKRKKKRRSSRSSQSSDESSKEFGINEGVRQKAQSLELGTNIFYRDVQGEEGDGLVIDPVVNAIKMKELEAKEKEVTEKLKKTLYIIENDLDKVSHELLIQTSRKSTATAASKSIEVLQSIIQPIKDIQTFLVTLEQQDPQQSSVSIAELIAPPIFDLQKGLAVVEKCSETQGKEHTLILKTCFNILDKTGPQIQRGLKLIENLSLLEKEMIPTNAAGRVTPSKIIQEVLTTLQEMQNGMDRALFVMNSKKALFAKQKPVLEQEIKETDIVETETDMDVLLKFAQPAFELQETLTNVKQSIIDVENVTRDMKTDIKEKIQEHVIDLVKQVMATEQQVIKLSESNMEHDLYSAILDNVSHTIDNLSNNIEKYSGLPVGNKYEEIEKLDLFESPIEEVINSLSRLGKNIPTSQLIPQEETPVTPQEVVKDVFDQVSQLIHENISQTVQTFLYNIETAQNATADTVVLEGLRQMATLQKDLSVTVRRSAEINTEPAIMALENLAQPLDMMNNQLLEVPTSTPEDILDDMVACLSILEDSIVLNEKIEEDEDLLILFSILKARAREVKENICFLIEPELLQRQEESPLRIRPPLRQNLSEENIAEEIIEEETFILPTPPIVEEDAAQSKYEDLKKCIATLQDMTIMGEKIEIAAEQKPDEHAQAFVETVQQLEKCLATLQEQSSVESAPTELFQETATVVECVEKLKNSSSMFEKPIEEATLTAANITEIQTLTGPLRRLSQTLVLLQNQQEERINVFRYVEDTLRDLATSLTTFNKERTIPLLVEDISDTLEVISLERSNMDIKIDEVHQLVRVISQLGAINEIISQSQEAEIRNIEDLDTPVTKLLSDLTSIGSETGLKYITNALTKFLIDLQNTTAKSRGISENIALVTENIVRNIETLSNEGKLALEESQLKEIQRSFTEFKESVKLIEIEKEEEKIPVYQNVQKSLCAMEHWIEELGQLSDQPEAQKAKLLENQIVMQEMTTLAQQLDTSIAEKLTAAVLACENLPIDKTVSITESVEKADEEGKLEVIKIIEPLVAILNGFEDKDLDKKDKKANINKIAKDWISPLKESLQKISKAEYDPLTPTQAKLLEELAEPLNAIKDYVSGKENDTKYLRSQLEKLKKIKIENEQHLTPVLNKIQESIPSLDLEIDKIIEIENQVKIQKMKSISKVTDVAQDIVKNVASIKYAGIDKASVIKLQRTLYALQISVNDLIDCDLDAVDEEFVRSIVASLESTDKFVVSKTSKDIAGEPVVALQDVLNRLGEVQSNFEKLSGTSEIRNLSEVLNSFTANADQVLKQLGKAYNEHIKTDFVETKFVSPITIIKQKAEVVSSKEEKLSVISDIKDYLLAIKQNAQIITEHAEETHLDEDEVNYLKSLEGLTESLDDIISGSEAEVMDVYSKLDKTVELIDLATIVESPLRNITPCVKEICSIITKVFKVTEENIESVDQQQAEVDVVIRQPDNITSNIEGEIAMIQEPQVASELPEVLEESTHVKGIAMKQEKTIFTDEQELQSTELAADTAKTSESLKIDDILETIAIQEQSAATATTVISKEELPDTKTVVPVEEAGVLETADSLLPTKVAQDQKVIEQTLEEKETSVSEEVAGIEDKSVLEIAKVSEKTEPDISDSIGIIKDQIIAVTSEEAIKLVEEPTLETATVAVNIEESVKSDTDKDLEILEIGKTLSSEEIAAKVEPTLSETSALTDNQIIDATMEEVKITEETEALEDKRLDELPETVMAIDTQISSDKDLAIAAQIAVEQDIKPSEVVQVNFVPLQSQLATIKTKISSQDIVPLTSNELQNLENISQLLADVENAVQEVKTLNKPAEFGLVVSDVENLLGLVINYISSDKTTVKEQTIKINESITKIEILKEEPIATLAVKLAHAIIEQDVKVEEVTKEKLKISLKSLKQSIESIERRPFSEEKNAAIIELEKSIVVLQSVIETKLQLEGKDLTPEETKALSKAEDTLQHISSFVTNISEEGKELDIGTTVETAKKSIEELRLAVVGIKDESSIKEAMEPLEETAKNVVNLFESITAPSVIEEQKLSPAFVKAVQDLGSHIGSADKTKLEEPNKGFYENIEQQLEVMQNQLSLLENVALKEQEKIILDASEMCLNEFLDVIKTSTISLENIGESKLNNILGNVRKFEALVENQTLNPTISQIASEVKQININILKLIEKPQPIGPKPIVEPLQKLQKDVETLQNLVSGLNVNSNIKTHKIVLNEFPRPLTTLQFVVENVLVGKNEKLTADDLNFLARIGECVRNIHSVIENAEDIAKPQQLEKIQASIEELKVILASVNLESQIKDILEPLQDISKMIERILEKETLVTTEFLEARTKSVEHLSKSLENISKTIQNRISEAECAPQLTVLTELERPAQEVLTVIANTSEESLTNEDIRNLNNLRNSVDDVCTVLRERETIENIDKLLQDLKQSIVNIAPLKEERVEVLPTPDIEKSFIEAIKEQLNELNKAIEFTHIVLEKPKTIEDISQLRDINNPLKELLKLVLTIKHQPQGELQLFSELQNPLRDLQIKLNDCVEAKIVPDEITILETVGKEFAQVVNISKTKKFSEFSIADFQEPLSSLRNVIITVCSKAVLSDAPKSEESAIQRILEPLDGIVKAIIKIETEVRDKIHILEIVKNIVSNINYLSDRFDNEDDFNNVEIFPKLKENLQILKISLGNKEVLHKSLEESQRKFEEILPRTIDPDASNLVQDTLKCFDTMKKEIETILSPSSDLDELQELGALDHVISQLTQILKAAELERIQSRRDIQAVKAIKEPLVLIQESIQSLKPMINDLRDENRSHASSITNLEESIEDICVVATEIEESVKIVDQPDITEEFSEKLMVLQEPLQKLSIAIGNFKASIQRPEITKIDSTPVLSALSAIKQSIELISSQKPEAQSLNILCQNLEPLSSKIEEIQETIKLEQAPRRDQMVSANFKRNLQELNETLNNIKSNVGGLKPFDKIMITMSLEVQNPIQNFIANFDEIQKVFDQGNLDDISEDAVKVFDEIIKILRGNVATMDKCYKAAVQNRFTQNELAEIKKALENIQRVLEKSTSIRLETYFMELMHSNLVTMKKSCAQILKQLEKSSLHLSTYETLVKVSQPLEKIIQQVPILKEKLEKTPALSDFNNLVKINSPIDGMKAQVNSMVALPAFDVYKDINEEHILKIISLKSTLSKLSRLVDMVNIMEPEREDRSKEVLALLQELRLEIGIIRSISIKLFENLQTPLESLSDILWAILKDLEKKDLYRQLYSDIIPSLNQLLQTIDAIPEGSDYKVFEKVTPPLQDFKCHTLKFCEEEETLALKDFIQAVANVSQPSKALVDTLVKLKEASDQSTYEKTIEDLSALRNKLDQLNFANIPPEKLENIKESSQTCSIELAGAADCLRRHVKVQGLVSNILSSLQSVQNGSTVMVSTIENLEEQEVNVATILIPPIKLLQENLSNLSEEIEKQKKSLREDTLLELNSCEKSTQSLSTSLSTSFNTETAQLDCEMILSSLQGFEQILGNLIQQIEIPASVLQHLNLVHKDVQSVAEQVNKISSIQRIKPTLQEVELACKNVHLPDSLQNVQSDIQSLSSPLSALEAALPALDCEPCQSVVSLGESLKEFSKTLKDEAIESSNLVTALDNLLEKLDSIQKDIALELIQLLIKSLQEIKDKLQKSSIVHTIGAVELNIDALSTKVEEIKPTAQLASVSSSLVKVVEPIHELKENILQLEALPLTETTSKDILQNLTILEEPLRKLSAATVNITNTVQFAKVEEIKLQLSSALMGLKEKIVILQSAVQLQSHPLTISEPLAKIADAVAEIQDAITPHGKIRELPVLKAQLEHLDTNCKSIKLQVLPQSERAVQTIGELSDKLIGLKEIILQLEQTNDDQVSPLLLESTFEQLAMLEEPLQLMSIAVQNIILSPQIQPTLTKENELLTAVKVMRENLESISSSPETQVMQVVIEPLKALQAQMKEIEEDIERKSDDVHEEQTPTTADVVSVSKKEKKEALLTLKEELKRLEIDCQSVQLQLQPQSEKPVQSIADLSDSLKTFQETISLLEDISDDQVSPTLLVSTLAQVKQLEEPVKLMAMTIEATMLKPQVAALLQDNKELSSAVKLFKKHLEQISASSESEVMAVVIEPVRALHAQISQIEEQMQHKEELRPVADVPSDAERKDKADLPALKAELQHLD
ncbi:hypothetical protein Trydic_g15005, partial [Trypoxylus dichotomus]